MEESYSDFNFGYIKNTNVYNSATNYDNQILNQENTKLIKDYESDELESEYDQEINSILDEIEDSISNNCFYDIKKAENKFFNDYQHKNVLTQIKTEDSNHAESTIMQKNDYFEFEDIPDWYKNMLQIKIDIVKNRLKNLAEAVSVSSIENQIYFKKIEQNCFTPFCKFDRPKYQSLDKLWTNSWKFNCIIKCDKLLVDNNHNHNEYCQIIFEPDSLNEECKIKHVNPAFIKNNIPEHVLEVVEEVEIFINTIFKYQIKNLHKKLAIWDCLEIKSNFKNELMLIVSGQYISSFQETSKQYFEFGPGSCLKISSFFFKNLEWTSKNNDSTLSLLKGSSELLDKISTININYLPDSNFNSLEIDLLEKTISEYLLLNKETVLLDIGFENGILSNMLANQCQMVVGCTSSDYSLYYAQNLSSMNKISNTKFIKYNFMEINEDFFSLVKNKTVAVVNQDSAFGNDENLAKTLRNKLNIWKVVIYGSFTNCLNFLLELIGNNDDIGCPFLPVQGCIVDKNPIIDHDFYLVILFERRNQLKNPLNTFINESKNLNFAECKIENRMEKQKGSSKGIFFKSDSNSRKNKKEELISSLFGDEEENVDQKKYLKKKLKKKNKTHENIKAKKEVSIVKKPTIKIKLNFDKISGQYKITKSENCDENIEDIDIKKEIKCKKQQAEINHQIQDSNVSKNMKMKEFDNCNNEKMINESPKKEDSSENSRRKIKEKLNFIKCEKLDFKSNLDALKKEKLISNNLSTEIKKERENSEDETNISSPIKLLKPVDKKRVKENLKEKLKTLIAMDDKSYHESSMSSPEDEKELIFSPNDINIKCESSQTTCYTGEADLKENKFSEINTTDEQPQQNISDENIELELTLRILKILNSKWGAYSKPVTKTQDSTSSVCSIINKIFSSPSITNTVLFSNCKIQPLEANSNKNRLINERLSNICNSEFELTSDGMKKEVVDNKYQISKDECLEDLKKRVIDNETALIITEIVNNYSKTKNLKDNKIISKYNRKQYKNKKIVCNNFFINKRCTSSYNFFNRQAYYKDYKNKFSFKRSKPKLKNLPQRKYPRPSSSSSSYKLNTEPKIKSASPSSEYKNKNLHESKDYKKSASPKRSMKEKKSHKLKTSRRRSFSDSSSLSSPERVLKQKKNHEFETSPRRLFSDSSSLVSPERAMKEKKNRNLKNSRSRSLSDSSSLSSPERASKEKESYKFKKSPRKSFSDSSSSVSPERAMKEKKSHFSRRSQKSSFSDSSSSSTYSKRSA